MDVYIWLGLLVLFLLAEAACPIHLVSIWFAVGALVSLVVSALSGPVWLQVLLFFVVSCGLLAMLLPLVKKVLNPKLEKTNVDSVIGSRGYVTGQIDNLNGQGQVKLGGMEWTARSVDGTIIPRGALIRVEKVEGVKVIVSRVPEEVKN